MLCACSGGLDSTVLAHTLNGIEDIELGILHVNHGIRGVEARKDADFVRQLADQYDLRFILEQADVTSVSSQLGHSVEEAGHHIRNEIYSNYIESGEYEFIATAHHADDQQETLLLNLLNGSGIAGLRGIGARQTPIVRPLLGFKRSELEEYARSEDLSYREDSSNLSLEYQRNRVRRLLLPELKELRPAIDELLLEISQSAQCLQTLIDDSVYSPDNEEVAGLSKSKLSFVLSGHDLYFSAVRKALFDKAFQNVSHESQGLSRKHFDQLNELSDHGKPGQMVQLPAGVSVYRSRSQLHFCLERSIRWSEADLHGDSRIQESFFEIECVEQSVRTSVDRLNDPCIAWVDPSRGPISIGPHRPGETITLMNRPGEKKVSQWLGDAGVLPHIRPVFPVLRQNDNPVWLPGIGASEELKINNDTIEKRLIRLEIGYREEIFE